MESQTGSTVHTSGFGAPPPGGGGFGPPPGGGGYGPPPGSPPPGGGFGPPPGAPPPGGGFGPPPGGQPPGGFGAPMAAPPPKKSNTMMFVGIGCVALLVLSCICIGGGYWYVSMKAQEQIQAMPDFQSPSTYGTVPTTDPGGAVAAPAGGDTCAKVDRCCPAFYVARGLPAEQAATTCAQMASARAMATGPMLETVCASQMQAFTSAGGGVPVPPECQ